MATKTKDGKLMRTEKEKQKLLDRIEFLKSGGLSTKDACEKVGISFSLFYSWKAKGNKPVEKTITRKKATPRLVTVPIVESKARMVIIQGDSEDVLKALGLMAEIARST